jgi:multimeric flavodoxin WrbA
MKVVILNGNPKADGSAIEACVRDLCRILGAAGHATTVIALREKDIGQCRGCWGCWVKTPGECVIRDGMPDIYRAVINADWLLLASPLIMGFPSALMKRALDRLIPLLHPYGAVDFGEAHHRARYRRYPKMGLLLEPCDSSPEELQATERIFGRTAINFKTRLYLRRLTTDPMEEVAAMMTGTRAGTARGASAPRLPPLIPPRMADNGALASIRPPTRLTLFNGSPRGKSGNTEVMLARFAEGFQAGGGSIETHRLMQSPNLAEMRAVYSRAECVLLGFPLYTDAMPGLVKAFIEELAPLRAKSGNPPMTFLVQSGFIEALHSRYVEHWLASLAARMGSPYLGTIVRGGGEGVRSGSENANRGLFDALHELGEGLARTGRLPPDALRRAAGRERFPSAMGPLFQLLLRLPIAKRGWDDTLKRNGAYQRRFARPYSEKR